MTVRPTHYDVLGVAPDAGPEELHRAYLALARRHHPDRRGGDDVRMRTINEAWATLGDPGRRRSYDLVLLRPEAPTGPTEWSRSGTGAASAPDLDDDLSDDAPVRITIVLPRWLAMLPAGLFAAALVLFFGGMVFGSALVALGLMALLSSLLMFLASPFVALYASRRPTGDPRTGTGAARPDR